MNNQANDSAVAEKKTPNLPLLNCFATRIGFEDAEYEIIYCSSAIKIALNEENYAVVTLKNQQVPYKATILGGFALQIQKAGHIEYPHHFNIVWLDEWSTPELIFYKNPVKILREYEKLQKIELGIEDFSQYNVVYADGVTADFTRTAPGAYEFSFSTGFHGSFVKETDGTHTVRFKGMPIEKDEDKYNSESKFIISRSKYTNNLLLILQDKATVTLRA